MSIKVFSPGEKIRAADFNDNFGHLSSQISTVDGFINGVAPIPVGFIAMWSGSPETVPAKWAICDGENGTVNLSGLFVAGAGDNYSVGDSGGLSEVVLSESEMPQHSHSGNNLSSSEENSHTHTYVRFRERISTTRAGSSAFRAPTWRVGSDSSLTGLSGAHSHSVSGTSSSVGSGEPHNNLPPYYSLFYIQKVS